MAFKKKAPKKVKKTSAPAKPAAWRGIADNMLGKTGDEGQATRTANAVMNRIGRK